MRDTSAVRISLAAVCAAIALVLTGCAAAPGPTPAASSVESATPSPTPVPEPSVTVVIVQTGVEIREDGSTITTLDRASDVDTTVGELTDVFGFAPAVTD